MNKIKIAVVQLGVPDERDLAVDKAERLVRKAAGMGANIVLLPELFQTPYFCQERRYEHYELALSADKDPAVLRFTEITRELSLVMPISFYERGVNSFYNSIAMLDSGELLGIYRKTHIPDDHFYQEKFYFSPGDTGFKVWETRFGKIGVGICWDQWFPESARCMTLMGAELLLYPTAIGSEPIIECDSMPHWRRCMQGHAAANIVPVAAANRVGTERITPDDSNAGQSSELTFYGSSFITDCYGEILETCDRTSDDVIISEFDLDKCRSARQEWGVFRDRRPEMYGIISGKNC